MDSKYASLIEKEFRSCVENTISRMEKEDTHKPFHDALLPKKVIYWSRFERSFSTSFGQKAIEEISKYAALSGGAKCADRQKETDVILDSKQLSAITRVITENRNGHPMNWAQSFDYVKSTPKGGDRVQMRVISDLWWQKDGIDNYMSIKTVKPNIDQTAIAKEDCLKLKVFNPECNTYFGLYYNPYGEARESYAHNPPKTIFDMLNDPVVLIGSEYWNRLGGEGFYEEILEIAASVGDDTRKVVDGLTDGSSSIGE